MSQPLGSSGFDTGSNYKFGEKVLAPNVQKSVFDLSHLVTTDIVGCGRFDVIDFFEVLPGDSIDIKCNTLIRSMPAVVPLYSRQRMMIYAFYSPCSSLWKQFPVFISKGRDGKSILTVPVISQKNCVIPDSIGSDKIEPNSVFNQMGVPLGLPLSQIYSDIDKNIGLNSMPFMMRLRVWRDYFCNRMLHLDDVKLYPDDDADFILNSSGEIVSYGAPVKFGEYHLASELYRDYPSDYFTSCVASRVRGEIPSLDIKFDLSLNEVNKFSRLVTGSDDYFAFKEFNSSPSDPNADIFVYGKNYPDNPSFPISGDLSWRLAYRKNDGSRFTGAIPSFSEADILGVHTPHYSLSGSPVKYSLTLDKLRSLAISQLELERIARTDGSYSEFGFTFFGISSRLATSYKPLFIGGISVPINHSEVLQTSQSSSDSFLGSYAGHGIGVTDDSYIGSFVADDYGYVMIVATIMPDVYYCQGLSKTLTRLNQSDWYLPGREKIGLVPVLNYELFLPKDGAHFINSDGMNLFAYQNSFDDYRYMPNKIKGKIADVNNISFRPYTQSRIFSSMPVFNQIFASFENNENRYYLAATNESAFTAQFSFDIRAVRPLPYVSNPSEVIN